MKILRLTNSFVKMVRSDEFTVIKQYLAFVMPKQCFNIDINMLLITFNYFTGHRNLLDLINEWEEFTVHYGTNEPIVKLAYGEDHIAEMNKHSK